MAEPQVIVEMEFTSGVWTDVSSYLKKGTTKRGKSLAVERSSPGRMTLFMRNELRTFDPEYSGNISPGNVKINIGVRVKAIWAAVTYPIFTGQVDRITQQYGGPRDATAVFSCSDGLAKLAESELASVFVTQMLNYAPHAWLRLGERQGPWAFDRAGGRHGVYNGSPEFGVQGLLFLDDDSAVRFEDADDFLLLAPDTLPAGVADWSVTFMLNLAAPLTGITFILFANAYPQGLTVWMDTAGRINAQVLNGLTQTFSRSIGSYALNNYIISIKAEAGQPLKIYHGGADVTDYGVDIGTGGVLASGHYVIGAGDNDLTLDEFITMTPGFAPAQLSELAFAAGAWFGNTGEGRIARVLDAVGWDAAARDITSDWDEQLRGTSLQTTALSHLETLRDTAYARLYVAKDGTITMIGREDMLTLNRHALSQATFGDGPGELPYTEIGDYSLDMQQVENVSRRRWRTTYEEEEFFIEASSVAPGERRRVGPEIDSQYMFPDAEYSLAQFRLDHLKDARPYVEGVKITPRKDPTTLFPQVLGLELLDRITWKRRPQNVGAAISTEVLIEGIGHSFAPKHWETTFFIDATDARKYFRFGITQFGSPDWRFT